MAQSIRPSSFNLYASGSTESLTDVYNTASRKQLRLSTPWPQVLEAAHVDSEIRERLIADGFLTTEENYAEECRAYLAVLRQQPKNKLTICFTVSTKCTLACAYCFQANCNKETASTETVDRFLLLLEQYLEAHRQIQTVELILFGGDPALAPALCYTLLKRGQAICSKQQVQLTSLMTTNGLLVENMPRLREAGLQQIMVTFDGNRPIHNQTRAQTFDTILHNLPLLASHFALVIKYNLHTKNSNLVAFEAFLDDVLKVLDATKFTIALEALHPTATLPVDDALFLDAQAEATAQIFLELHQACTEKSVACSFDNSLHPPCPATRGGSLTIQPSGDVVSCSAAASMDEFVIGNIFSLSTLDLSIYDRHQEILQALHPCIETQCVLFPLCETGCPYTKRLHGIPANRADCRVKYIQGLLPAFTSASLEGV